jgi:hypothetical protein
VSVAECIGWLLTRLFDRNSPLDLLRYINTRAAHFFAIGDPNDPKTAPNPFIFPHSCTTYPETHTVTIPLMGRYVVNGKLLTLHLYFSCSTIEFNGWFLTLQIYPSLTKTRRHTYQGRPTSPPVFCQPPTPVSKTSSGWAGLRGYN